jgi:hypothetical protein
MPERFGPASTPVWHQLAVSATSLRTFYLKPRYLQSRSPANSNNCNNHCHKNQPCCTAFLLLTFRFFWTVSRYCSVPNTRGNFFWGSAFPRNLHKNSHPCLTLKARRFSLGTLAMTVSIMLFIPISSFSSESTSRGIENMIFHEMVESMWWKEQREESGDQRWFETRGLGEVVIVSLYDLYQTPVESLTVRTTLALGYAFISFCQKIAQGTSVTT